MPVGEDDPRIGWSPAAGRASGTSIAPASHSVPQPWLSTTVLGVVVVLWGMNPPVLKLISAPPVATVTVRLWLSVPVLWALVLANGGSPTWRVLRRAWLAGSMYGLHSLFVLAALQQATVAVVTVIFALQASVVVAASPLLGERVSGYHLAWTGIGTGGAVVVVLGAAGSVRSTPMGIVLAVLAMLTFVAFFLSSREVRAAGSVNPFEWTAATTTLSAVTVSVPALVRSDRAEFGQLGGDDWWYLAFAVGAVSVGGHVLVSWVTRYVEASRSALVLLAQNVVSVAVAWPLHDEPISLVQAAGGLAVLASAAAVVVRPPRLSRSLQRRATVPGAR